MIKVIWGGDWDPLLERDTSGLLAAAHGRGRRRRDAEVHRQRRRLHPRALLRQVPRAARAGRATTRDEQLRKLRRGGHDPEKVYAAYKAAVEHKGAPDGDPGADHQGLRPGRGRRGPQHHPPAEEAERGGAAGVPHPLRHPDLRRRRRRRRRSTGPPTTARRSRYLQRAARRRWAARCPSASCKRGSRSACQTAGHLFSEFLEGTRRPRGRHHHGLRAHARASCCATRSSASWSCRSSPTRRAPSAWSRCSARSASTPTSASSTSRSTATACSTTTRARPARSSRRASPRPARMASFIAAGTAYADQRHQHHPLLHLLLDVRLPAHRRPDLGRRRHAQAAASWSAAPPAAPRWPARACSTRTATATCWRCPRRSHQGLRPGLRLRAGGHRPRRHPPHVLRAARTGSTTSRS